MTTFRGGDIIATFNDQVIGQLHSMDFSVSRENSSIYTIGSAPGHNSFSGGMTLDRVVHEDAREDIRRQLAESYGVDDDVPFYQWARAVRLSMRHGRRGYPDISLQVDNVDYSIMYPATFSVVKSKALDFKKFIRPIEMDESKFTYVNPNNSHRSWKLNREEEVYYD